MAAQILGLSASPIANSNTDRAVQAVLAATGMETVFIKLHQLKLSPCRACLGCVKSNVCVQQDDGQALARQFREARAFVLGAWTPYSSLDAMSKLFMERMYCLRHQTGLNRGKIGALVVTTACDPAVPQLPPAAQTAIGQVAVWMMEEGMTNLGSMTLLGNVPCIRCGHGDDCPMSGIKMLHGPDANVASVGVRSFGADQQQAAARELGAKLRAAVLAAG